MTGFNVRIVEAVQRRQNPITYPVCGGTGRHVHLTGGGPPPFPRDRLHREGTEPAITVTIARDIANIIRGGDHCLTLDCSVEASLARSPRIASTGLICIPGITSTPDEVMRALDDLVGLAKLSTQEFSTRRPGGPAKCRRWQICAAGRYPSPCRSNTAFSGVR